MKFGLCTIAAAVVLAGIPVTSIADASGLLAQDQAFAVASRPDKGGSIAVEFSMAPGYVLYQDKMSFSTSLPSVRLAPAFPQPQSKYIEGLDQEVSFYSNQVTIRLAVSNRDKPFTLTVGAQGCAIVQGVCYPPFRKTFVVPAQRLGGT